MADRELQNILSSGELTGAYFNDTSAGNRVPTVSDITATNAVYDDTSSGITATTTQQALDVLSNVGFTVMSGNSLTPQTIATSATKVNVFDTLQVEAGVGATGDVAQDRATATLDGVFKLRFEAFISYASNVDITWQIYKKGSPFGNSITLSGQGTKVFPITLLTSTNLIANDYLELYATASSSTDITISQSNGTLEKTIF